MIWRCDSAAVSVWVDKIMCCWWRPEFAVQHFDIMRKTVRKWKEVGAKDNYFFKYNLSIRQPHTGNFLEVLYKKRLFYYGYRKLDGMWKLDGSYVLDAERLSADTRIGYRYASLYGIHEVRLAAMAYSYACQMVIGSFTYLKFNELWKLADFQFMDAQKTEYITKQAYSFGVGYARELRVIWHEAHNLIFLDGTWNLDGSKIIDAWQKMEVL